MASEGNFAPVIGGESDSDVVYAQISTDANDDTVLVGADGLPLFSEISLYGADEFADGEPQLSGQNIASATINSAATGTALQWSNILLDSTGGEAWDIANPARIVVPPGITKAWFTGSVMFPANGTGARMLRLLKSGSSHMSNVLLPTSHGVAPQSLVMSTGWIDVVAGDYYQFHAVQDSGSTLVPALGTLANKGGSTWARVSFKK